MMKLMIVGRRRGGMTLAQLHRYMVDVHGAMVVALIAEHPSLTPQRYVQNHVVDGTFRVPGSTPDPFSVSRDFVTQVWFDNPAQAKAATEAPFYLEKLQPDEDRFVDQASVVKLPVAARQVFGADRPLSKTKLFVFHRRAPGVSAEQLAAATLALWQPQLGDAARGVECLVRNTVLPQVAERAGVDLVDEVWLRDEDASRAVGEHWQHLAEGPGVAPLTAPGSCVLLHAREQVLFAGAGH